jgi:arginine exporter protein ArgO
MNKRADLALAAAALICVGLMCVRAVSVFPHGPYIITSGGEAESLFAIWKWIHKQPVYANPFAPPFAQSYFNWLFYWVYGAFNSAILAASRLDSSALPVITRGLTLALTVVCMLIVYQLLDGLSFIRRIAGSAIVAFSPLVGFWAVTARPDVAALACALVGAWCIVKADRSQSRFSAWIGMAFVAFYCAWAFKQSYIAPFTAAVLHFCLARKWKPALWFGVATVLAIAVTLILGTPEYRYAAISSQSHMPFLLSEAKGNLSRAIAKAPLLLFGLVSVIACLRRDRTNFFAWWAIISLPLMTIVSAKAGASDNYFFEPVAACSILFLLEGRHLTAASIAQIVSPALIFAGVTGMAFMRPQPELALLKSELVNMNGSVFVLDQGGNLPWIQQRPPNFVLATTYDGDKALGKPFAFGGIGGMVRSGRIDLVVCPRDQVDVPFDGMVPASLREIKEDSRWAYFSTH